MTNLIGLQGCRSISIAPRSWFARVSLDIYRTWQMFRISYFWQDWNSFVRLAVFHNAFSAKRSHSYFFSKICLKLLIIGFLACVAYCSAQLNRLETVPFAKSNRFASVSIDTYCSIKYVCKCLSIDTCTYIAQLNRFVRVSMSIIHCCDRVQNDGEAAFCGI